VVRNGLGTKLLCVTLYLQVLLVIVCFVSVFQIPIRLLVWVHSYSSIFLFCSVCVGGMKIPRVL